MRFSKTDVVDDVNALNAATNEVNRKTVVVSEELKIMTGIVIACMMIVFTLITGIMKVWGFITWPYFVIVSPLLIVCIMAIIYSITDRKGK